MELARLERRDERKRDHHVWCHGGGVFLLSLFMVDDGGSEVALGGGMSVAEVSLAVGLGGECKAAEGALERAVSVVTAHVSRKGKHSFIPHTNANLPE